VIGLCIAAKKPPRMSEMGLTRPLRHVRVESVLHPTSDIGWCARHGRKVPGTAVSRCSEQWPYSITSSARIRNASGISRLIALAALRLITSSKRVGTSIGRLPGFSPFRMIFSTRVANR
jgi:hypothetical protein